MYYKPKDGCPLPATLPELIGQITACPNKKSNQKYKVKWIRPSDGSSWPEHLQEHLVNNISKDLIHAELAVLIARCLLNNRERTESSNNNPATRPSGQAATTDTPDKQVQGPQV
jgi:hypothetical protein